MALVMMAVMFIILVVAMLLGLVPAAFLVLVAMLGVLRMGLFAFVVVGTRNREGTADEEHCNCDDQTSHSIFLLDPMILPPIVGGMRIIPRLRLAPGLVMLLALIAPPAHEMGGKSHPPLRTVPRLDLQAFMGDWNVLGNLPSSQEEGCHNALEQYELKADGDVAITFSCSKGSFEAEREVSHFTGIIQNPGVNTDWRVKMKVLGFIPIKLPYLVIDLADDGSYTVIGYPSREYVWIMARTKSLPEETWAGILERLAAQGYDVAKIQRVPIR